MGNIKIHKKITVPVNTFLLVAFIAFIIYVTINYAPDITRMASEPEKFREFISSYGYTGVLVFIFFQFVQVVIAAIPGEVVQIAGGYIYGTVLGSLYSVIGIFTGYIVVFFLSRALGYPLVRTFVSSQKIQKFNFLMNSKKSEVTIFVLFLIPGLPKDILVYIAGLTPVKPLRFFILTLIARLPALIGSSFIGANLQEKNYTMAIIVFVAAIVLFAVGLFFRDRIIDKIKRVDLIANK